MKVTIDRLDHQGRGITYINNKIVFVENALPEEIVEIEIVKEDKKFSEAKVINYIKESSKRVKPICPYYEECGGCNLLHLSYQDQLVYKEDKVKNIMKKYASIEEDKIKKIIPSPKQYNYRNKVTLKCNNKLGYYKRRSNDLVNIDYCYLVNDNINDVIKRLDNMDKEINEVVIRNIKDNDISLTISLQKELKNYDKYKNIVDKTTLLYKNNIISTNKESNIIARLDNKEYKVSPTAFFQVNTEQTVNLYNKIRDYVKEMERPNVLDLYCGTGTIGIYISDYANKVVGVEINSKAIEDAKQNAKLNNTNNIEFYSGDTKDILLKNKFTADLIIVDPPRQGLDEKVVEELIKLNPKKIIYVSCDPITLARDIKRLDIYKVLEVTPVDMFPNTYHVENIVLFERNN